MEALRQYVISVAAAAMIGGIVMGLFPSGTAKQVVKLICGLFLAYTVLSPLPRMDFSEKFDLSLQARQDALEAASLGESLARDSVADIIKSETEAYILDKAQDLRAEVEVEVTLNEENVPAGVTVSGNISPSARKRLEAILETDLGIAKEDQQWTG